MESFSIKDLETLEERIKQQQEDIQRLIVMKKAIRQQEENEIKFKRGKNRNSRSSLDQRTSDYPSSYQVKSTAADNQVGSFQTATSEQVNTRARLQQPSSRLTNYSQDSTYHSFLDNHRNSVETKKENSDRQYFNKGSKKEPEQMRMHLKMETIQDRQNINMQENNYRYQGRNEQKKYLSGGFEIQECLSPIQSQEILSGGDERTLTQETQQSRKSPNNHSQIVFDAYTQPQNKGGRNMKYASQDQTESKKKLAYYQEDDFIDSNNVSPIKNINQIHLPSQSNNSSYNYQGAIQNLQQSQNHYGQVESIPKKTYTQTKFAKQKQLFQTEPSQKMQIDTRKDIEFENKAKKEYLIRQQDYRRKYNQSFANHFEKNRMSQERKEKTNQSRKLQNYYKSNNVKPKRVTQNSKNNKNYRLMENKSQNFNTDKSYKQVDLNSQKFNRGSDDRQRESRYSTNYREKNNQSMQIDSKRKSNQIISGQTFSKKWIEEEQRRRSIHDMTAKVQTNHYAAQEKRGPQFGITDHCHKPHEKDNRMRLQRSKDPEKKRQDIKASIKYQVRENSESSVPRDSSYRWQKEFTKMQMTDKQFWECIPPKGFKGTRLQWLEYQKEFRHIQRSPSPQIKQQRRTASYERTINTESESKLENMKMLKVAIDNIRFSRDKSPQENMKAGGSYGPSMMKNLKAKVRLMEQNGESILY